MAYPKFSRELPKSRMDTTMFHLNLDGGPEVDEAVIAAHKEDPDTKLNIFSGFEKHHLE